MEEGKLPLVDNFRRFFRIDLATTQEQLEATYGIRYRVYCEELGLEPAEQFPDGLERDQYDNHSLTCLVTHKRSGLPVSCVRMVEASEARLMPFEPHCRDSIDVEHAGLLYEDRDTVVECSRLAVDTTFRRRLGQLQDHLGEECCHLEQRSFSLVGIVTLLAGFAAAGLAGRPNILAMMEPYLPRLLRQQGIRARKVGERVEYHGRRAPYFLNIEAALPTMRADLQALYELERASLSAHFASLQTDVA